MRNEWLRAMLAPTLVLSLLVAVPRPARADIDAALVKKSIDKGIEWLLKNQNPNKGNWPDVASYEGGVTALCTLALLNAGMKPNDPPIQKALAYLRTHNLEVQSKVYVVSLETMVFCAAEPKRDLLIISRNAKWLEEAQTKSGMWSYTKTGGGGGDNSNTQFALLALHEAARAGVAVGDKTWRASLDHWEKSQNLLGDDGSWGYTPGQAGSGSMTCAGIASVIICAEQLSDGDATLHDNHVRCCGNQINTDALDRAMKWMERNFSVERNPGTSGQQAWLMYYLYGLERAGRMTNQRFIGDHDWYRTGTEFLTTGRGKPDPLSGFWPGMNQGGGQHVVGTSMALLFLAKGRRPVVVAKYKREPNEDWNRHRNDLANLTTFVESRWQRDLTWQVIDSDKANVDDLLQTPVLFMNGRLAPDLNAGQKRNLRDYIDRGGFLFAEACCHGEEFDRGFRKLMEEVFPEEEYRLKLLPPEHPIWHAEEPVHPDFARPLYGINVGCRTSVVFCPEDLSCYWELGRPGRDQKLPKRVLREVEACRAIGINVLAYATNREVKFKYEIPTVSAEKATDPNARGKIYVAKLLHPGGCNAAPAALTNLMRVAADKLKLQVSTEQREVAPTDQGLYDYHLVFMHGRQAFRFTEEERKNLKQYLERGGMLLADAVCSNSAFDASFRSEMESLFPGQPLERIPAGHPIFTPAFGGDDITVVSRRQPARGDGPLKPQLRQVEPLLEGIKIGDRWAVLYSRYDLSCALENHDSLECEGYTRADAARIGLNALLYSLHQ